MANKKRQTNKILFFTFTPIILLAILSFNFLPEKFSAKYENVANSGQIILDEENKNSFVSEDVVSGDNVKYVRPPQQVKAIYMTACVLATPSFRQSLVDLIETTEINSIVIDIKDFSGTISFETENPKLVGINGTGCRARDVKDFIATLHEKNIYVIGRITVFQDPYITKIHPELAVKKMSDQNSVWKDFKGISFVDVSAKDHWDYILELTKESHKIGFDEINFDYIRFPSDGDMKDIYYPFSNKYIVEDQKLGKQIALEEFFKYLDKEISKYNKGLDFPLITSADLFGMVTTNTDDLNIGQVLERALPYFDYIAPMVYPSHYPSNFNGWADPNKYPYELIYFVMKSAVDRVNSFASATTTSEFAKERASPKQLRTWIQDFDYGGNYDIAEVKAQIQGSYDAGVDSWMIWSPSNRYTKGALKES